MTTTRRTHTTTIRPTAGAGLLAAVAITLGAAGPATADQTAAPAEDGPDAPNPSGLTVVGPDGEELEPGWTMGPGLQGSAEAELDTFDEIPATDTAEDGSPSTNAIRTVGAGSESYAWTGTGVDATLVEYDHDGAAEPVAYTLDEDTDIGEAAPLDMMAHPDPNDGTVLWTAGNDEGTRLMQLDPEEGVATEVASTADGELGETIVGVSEGGVVTESADGSLHHSTYDGETTELAASAEEVSLPGIGEARTAAYDGSTVVTTRADEGGVVVEQLDVESGGEPTEIATIEGEGLTGGDVTFDEGHAVVTVYDEQEADRAVVLDVASGEVAGVFDGQGASVSGAVQDGSLWMTAATVGGEVEPTATSGAMWRLDPETAEGEMWLDEPVSGADASGGQLLVDEGLGGLGDSSRVISQGQ
ncbi:hypothetical protein ACPYO6_15700 [Georgenia sp. Z1344]|uniref:hypothetical protein n=1 Tax=Georgenia sp. Z1344 TaxID=3416706 RepID=UPI003CEAEE08